jgi:hypothetical protein
MRLVLILLAAALLVAGCGGSDEPDAQQTPSGEPSVVDPATADPATAPRIEFQRVSDVPISVAAGSTELLIVAKNIAAPGFRAYEVRLNFDETMIDVEDIQDVAFAGGSETPLCIAFPKDTDSTPGDSKTNISCGLPQPKDEGLSGDVTLARVVFKAIKPGETTVVLESASLAEPNLRTIIRPIEAPEDLTLQLVD